MNSGSIANGNSPKLGISDNADFLELTVYNNTGATTTPVILIDDLNFSQDRIVADVPAA